MLVLESLADEFSTIFLVNFVGILASKFLRQYSSQSKSVSGRQYLLEHGSQHFVTQEVVKQFIRPASRLHHHARYQQNRKYPHR